MAQLEEKVCQRCLYHWVARTVSPVKCPACLSRKWREQPKGQRQVRIGRTTFKIERKA